MMKKRPGTLIAVTVGMLVFSAAAVAQLPTPTYGWNLGNTMEPPDGEGTWNNPAVTEALIDAVAAAGFNTIRIPVAWNSHADQSTYEIDASWMARVQEVVDWCYAANLHVIINSHWDNGWLDSSIDGSVDATINAKVDAYWTQIAEAFIDYDDQLLFACTNEPEVDTASEMTELLTYEQTFVDAVRGVGGNNTARWLVVQGPCTDISLTDELMDTLPSDSTSDRLMVEVHYYDPYQFTLMTSDADWGYMFYFWGEDCHHSTMTERNPTWGEEVWMSSQFQKMYTRFVSQGVPVLLGEFGAIKRIGYTDLTDSDLDLHLESRACFHKTIVDTANSMGILPVYWDNGSQSNNGFALFNRTTAAIVDSDNITALTGDGDTTAPSTPTGLTAGLDGINAVLDWDDNTEEDLGGYHVYRSTTSGSDYEKLNTETVTDSEYTDNTTDGDETYYYVVSAVDVSSNESDYSDEVSVSIAENAQGTILYEVWTGISGTSVDDLTSSADYPDSPSDVDQLSSLEGPVNWADTYGTRIRGYLYPPVSGDYTFWIAGDDNCQLWLSTDGTTANAALIASVSDWTDSQEWDKYTEQESETLSLTAGQKYYIEVLHKEGSGGDHIAVAWSGPEISQAVISGRYLSPWLSGLYGDFTGEGDVDIEDLEVLAGLWLIEDCSGTAEVDLDGDCTVGLYEFSELAKNWLSRE